MKKQQLLIILVLLLFIIITGCKNKNIQIEMVMVEKGSFIMGNDSGNPNEKPAHEVTFTKSFLIGKYEVTYEQYDLFCQYAKKKKPMDYGWGREKRPVIGINLYDEIEFCNWMSKNEKLKPCYIKIKEGQKESWKCDFTVNGYRLPTEAEWEYAAKGGNKSKNFIYSGSDIPDEVAWYRDNSQNMTQPVGQKNPNELGIYDMTGNVLERCWDYTGNYKKEQKTDPTGPLSGTGFFRIVRGGSWDSNKIGLTTIFRKNDDQLERRNNLGFRVVRLSE